jgi:RES domain-containing protein
MLNPPALAPAIAAARPMAVPLLSLLFRSIHLRHFSNFTRANPLFAAAGGAAGSRYVLPNGPAALYAAFDADTALREGNQAFYQAALGPAGQALIQANGLRPDPVVVLGVHVRVTRLLDLRDPLTRLQLGIQSVVEIVGPWKGVPNAPTQVLGDAVHGDGQFEGIVYPSVQNPGHECLVVFPSRLDPKSRINFADTITRIRASLP